MCREEFDELDSKKYSADSSYASAVHIATKLSYCLEWEGIDKAKVENWQDVAIQILAEAVNNQSDLFKKNRLIFLFIS